MATSQFDSFIKTLKKVFMLDQADLDFGIYRIMNQKRKDIEKYLNENLKTQVKEVLDKNKSSKVAELENELKEARKAAETLGISPDDMPKVKELQSKIASLGNTEDLENEVYSHLSIFFSRYYDNGDFVSQRRYKKDVYAIPYEGEEVKLYWANADQYYIKTSEYFRNYRFKLDSGRYVEFILKDVSTEQNNNKAQNNMERRFALYEECPVEVINDELHINFTYELYPKATKQKALMESAYTIVKDLLPVEFKMDVLVLRPTESNRTRTLLQKHLTDYVARNTFDYFIHKDLKGFLSRELDFYIKNEILEIDDIDARTTESFLAHLTVIKAIKNVGSKIIEFLASLEDFQKRLWLKKKMVVSADYCITLDRVPEKFYAEICANDAQREEWVKLFAIDEIKSSKSKDIHGYSVPLTDEFLRENSCLLLDTTLFTEDFKQRLVSEIDNLDEQCDGLLVNSENFQALNFMQEKYRQSIKCIYIDPPYNAKSSEIMYKNTFKHASWLSLMYDRLNLGKEFLNLNNFVQFIAIDEVEQEVLGRTISNIFDNQKKVCISIVHNPRGQQGKNISYTHEFAFIVYPNDQYKFLSDVKRDEIDSRNLRDSGTESDRIDAATCFYPFITKDGKIIGIGEVPDENYHPSGNNVMKENGILEIWPIDDNGNEKKWRYSVTSVSKILSKLEVKEGRNSYQIIFNQDMGTMKSLWINSKYDASEYGTKVLQAILGVENAKKFSYPKSIYTVTECLNIGLNGANNAYVLDYFAGSSTTAHAVINLNRKDKGKRKYILVEMGEYFEPVTKERVQKVIYSEDWNNGKPVSRKGISHCFKYLRLEQYEDTLNNLVVRKNTLMDQEGEFFDGYMLGYLLDTETKDSLFSLDWFVNPWNTKLKITRNNEIKEEKIDLIETFNYLIGLNVQRITYPKSEICVVEGYNRKEEHILVIWRDCTKVSNEDLNDFFKRMAYSTRDREFDKIYVNGDNNLENLKTDADIHGK